MASLSKQSVGSAGAVRSSRQHPLVRPAPAQPAPGPEFGLFTPVSQRSLQIFENHVRVGREGAGLVKPESLKIYQDYVAMRGC